MKSYTKAQRHKIYKKVFNVYNQSEDLYMRNGVCWQINYEIRGKKIHTIDSLLTQERFKELSLFEPDCVWMGMFWKSNECDQRFLALCFMIEMTK